MEGHDLQAGGSDERLRATLPMPGWLPAGLLLAFTVGGLGMVALAATGRLPWLVPIGWWLVLAWNGYVWGWLFAYELVVDGETLSWRGLVRRGQVGIAELVSIKSTGLGMAFHDRRGRRIQMLPLGGLEAIIRQIQQRNPAVVVDSPRGTRGQFRRP
jgi:hypothetical protein